MACGAAHKPWCSPHHEWIVTTYRDARDAVLALHGHNHQMEDDELPRPPTFRQWLQGHAGMNSDDRAEAVA